jgi:dGTP triphosphohydrolase
MVDPIHRHRIENEKAPLERVVCDYRAGMPDRFAERQWQQYCL